ncbi:hypothetical protein BN2537_14791 [Streptomyces venezuelae]|nr:hypothetical protein BN2537_14791 [Streptomyces venezuelae]
MYLYEEKHHHERHHRSARRRLPLPGLARLTIAVPGAVGSPSQGTGGAAACAGLPGIPYGAG